MYRGKTVSWRYNLYVNDITTGQLLARQDTEGISHEPFQALRRLLHKYTDVNHSKATENMTIYRIKFAPGPSLTYRKFFF